MPLKIDATAEQTFWQIVGGLRAAREDAGLSRQALASPLRVQHGTIFEWEKGTCRPTFKHLVLWARELGFHLVIMGPEGNERRDSSKRIAGEPLVTRELRGLVSPLKALRVARGLTLIGVSETIGVDRNSLLRWESTSGTPRPMALIVWARALNCSVALQPIGVHQFTQSRSQLRAAGQARRVLSDLDPTSQKLARSFCRPCENFLNNRG